MPDRTRARELAAEFLRRGDPTGWFEPLYQEAAAGKSLVPWADLCTNPHLLGFWKNHPQQTAGKLALVIGSGLGDDAEQLSVWRYRTTAFDISESAIRAARKRYPKSLVEYHVSDLLHPPASFSQKFDFVFEAYTLQVLPAALRTKAIQKIARFFALVASFSSSPAAASPPIPRAKCPGLSLAANSRPLLTWVYKNSPSKTFSIPPTSQFAASASSTAAHQFKSLRSRNFTRKCYPLRHPPDPT